MSQPSGRSPRAYRLVLVPPALTVVLAVLALGGSSEWFSTAGGFDGFTLGVLVWSCSPAVVLWLLAAGTLRERRRRVVTGTGGLLLLAFSAVAYVVIRVDDSSTAALGYLFVPLYGWVVVVLTAVALGVVALVRRSTST